MPIVSGNVNVDVEMEVEVYCAYCGEGLCKNSKAGTTRGRNQTYIEVSPCEKCLDRAKDEGKVEGYNERDNESRTNP